MSENTPSDITYAGYLALDDLLAIFGGQAK